MIEVEEVEGEAGEAGTLGRTSQKYIISVRLLYFFISLKLFLYGTNPSSTVCFSFSARIIQGSMS